jgi:pyrrolidone-carboxylate peptidase
VVVSVRIESYKERCAMNNHSSSDPDSKILVTGFSPFGLRAVPLPGVHGNRSAAICRRLQMTGDLANRIWVEVLEVNPVSARITTGALERFHRLLGATPSFAGVLMMGEVQTLTTGIRVEPQALGEHQPMSTPFSRDAAVAAASRSANETGIPGHVSGQTGIGQEGCNQLYFAAQSWARARQPVPPVLFIHCGFRDSLDIEVFQVKRYLWQMLDWIGDGVERSAWLSL